MRAIVAEAPGSSELGGVMRHFWAARLTQVGPIIDAAVGRQQLPPATSAAELMKFIAAPLYYQLLMTDEPLTEASADRPLLRSQPSGPGCSLRKTIGVNPVGRAVDRVARPSAKQVKPWTARRRRFRRK